MIEALLTWDWWLDGWIVAVGILCSVSCALLGNFLVLRKMSMMGDAISHAVLPGLAVAFLLTEDRTSWPMFVGAAIAGVLTALFTEWVRGYGKVDEGASMGVVFTALFALGLVLIVRGADSVDLDPGCVLYGAMESTPFDMVRVFGMGMPRVAVTLGGVLLLNALFVLVFYKELKLTSFDPALATTLGINSRVMHYVLMTLVAITAVAAFEAVGNILVVAVLIVPPAAAYLLTDRLRTMILLSVLIAAASAVLGHMAAIAVPAGFGYSSVSSAASMAVVTGLLFAAAMLFAPQRGVISKLRARGDLSRQIERQDVLALLFRVEEHGGSVLPAHLGDALDVSVTRRSRIVDGLRQRGLVMRDDARISLTDLGRDKARDLVRSHRLWEAYLDQHADLRRDHLHLAAERLEHATNAKLQAELKAETGQPQVDPHGREIP